MFARIIFGIGLLSVTITLSNAQNTQTIAQTKQSDLVPWLQALSQRSPAPINVVPTETIGDWTLGEVADQSPDAIVWQTELGRAYDLANKQRIPLAIFLYAKDEKGLMPASASVTEAIFPTREFNALKPTAVFLRLNADPSTASQRTQKLLASIDAKEFPVLLFVECHDSAMISGTSIIGDKSLEEYVRAMRQGVVESMLSIHIPAGPPCSEADFMRAVENFQFDTNDALAESENADQAMQQTLKKLRDNSGFTLAQFLSADDRCAKARLGVVQKVAKFAEVQSPQIRAFCHVQLENFLIYTSMTKQFRSDLQGLAQDGKTIGDDYLKIAQAMLEHYEDDYDIESQAINPRLDKANTDLQNRFDQILQKDTK